VLAPLPIAPVGAQVARRAPLVPSGPAAPPKR